MAKGTTDTAPARKAAPRLQVAAGPAEPAVTEVVAPPPNGGKAAKPQTIQFRGRTMTVQFPTAEQLAVWNRTAKRAADIGERDITSQEAAALLDRVLRIIQSVLVEQTDRDWVEDELLDGGLLLAGDGGATDIITKTVELMRDQAADQPPAAGPAKARRRR